MAKEKKALSSKEIETLKKKLLIEKEKLSMNSKGQENFCLDKNELADVLDEANVNIQTHQELRFRSREIFYLKKLQQALLRIEEGTFGICDDCNGPIGIERLSARPTADLCINCKEESEMVEKNNVYQSRSKSLGKTMAEIGR